MINLFEVVETNEMITKENLDVRTITLGISLLDCIDSNLEKLNEKICRKIYDAAKNLVKTGEDISAEFGIPIVNKRISVTPVALVGGAACHSAEDFASIAGTLDKVAKEVGKLYRRVFRACIEGNDICGRTFNPLHSPCPVRYGAGVQLRQFRLHQNGH